MKIFITKFRIVKAKQPHFPHFKYPFDYTNTPEKFQLYDSRFYEEPITLQLHDKQKSHICYVLQNFGRFLNQGKLDHQASKYIQPKLIQKTHNFQQMLKKFKITTQFQFNLNDITKSEGYLQCYGLENFTSSSCLQDYEIHRQNQQIRFKIKEKQSQTQLDKQKDNQKQKSTVEKMKKQMLGNSEDKIQNIVKITDRINSFMFKKTKNNAFQKYYYVDRIQSTMRTKYRYSIGNQQKTINLKNLLITKWLYIVDSLQPQDLRQSRKRVLFDFQLWNRGFFIPNKQYIPQTQLN